MCQTGCNNANVSLLEANNQFTGFKVLNKHQEAPFASPKINKKRKHNLSLADELKPK